VICTSCGVLVGVNDDKCYNCGRRNPGLWGFAPALRSLGGDLGFVPFVIGTCAVLSILTFVASGRGDMRGGLLGLLAPSGIALLNFGASGGLPVFGYGRWWTVLSAGWLHGGLLHIFVNMMSLRQLAPAIAELYGPGRMIIVYTAGSVTGFVLSSCAAAYLPPILFLRGSTLTVGASAAIAGLIGAVLAYGHRSGSSIARSYATNSIIMVLLMGFFVPVIDNYAHIGGFAGGYVAARYLDPLKPERVDHIVIALGCLAASLLAVIWSVLHPVG
jgi:rhomboid protease GluP